MKKDLWKLLKIIGISGMLIICGIFGNKILYNPYTTDKPEPISVTVIEDELSTPEEHIDSENNTVIDQTDDYDVFKEADLSDIRIPDYEEYPDQAYVIINNNQPLFDSLNYHEGFEYYSELDSLNRPQTAMCLVSKTTMPKPGEERGEIGMIKPVGWHTVKYPKEVISDLYLYNRCHLIGWQLGAENANEKNLITGTRYLNVTGMLPFENMIDNYVDETNDSVLYRVTPIYVKDELLCRGLLLEAKSINSDDCVFCVYCFNVQPDIYIDYQTGDSEQISLNINPVDD